MKALKEAVPCFRLVGDVATAYKHFTISRYKPATSRTDPLKFDGLEVPIVMLYGANYAFDEQSDALLIKLQDSPDVKIPYQPVLGRVTNMWKCLLDNPGEGVIDLVHRKRLGGDATGYKAMGSDE